jgi:hypothetical protein
MIYKLEGASSKAAEDDRQLQMEVQVQCVGGIQGAF